MNTMNKKFIYLTAINKQLGNSVDFYIDDKYYSYEK